MWLMVRVYHAMSWRRTAYRAYREIEAVCTDTRDLVRCQVEQAGLLMELARSGSGRLADCRVACAEVLSQFAASDDEEITQHCATAALMAAESLYYEDDRAAAIEELTRVVEEFSGSPRESAMALHFLAHAMWRDGRGEDAIEVFEHIVLSQLGEEENFPTFDLSQRAHRDLIFLADEMGRHQLAEQRLLEFIQAYPHSQYLTHLADRLADSPNLPEEVRSLLRQHETGSDGV